MVSLRLVVGFLSDAVGVDSESSIFLPIVVTVSTDTLPLNVCDDHCYA